MILLDTHVVVWLAFDQSQLSRNAKAAINDARQNGDGLAISDITLLELTTLSRKAPSASISVSNPFCTKSRHGSLSCRSAAARVYAPSHSQRPILRILPIALLEPPR